MIREKRKPFIYFGETQFWCVHHELLPSTKEQWKKAWRIARKLVNRCPIEEDIPNTMELCRFKGLLYYAIMRVNERRRPEVMMGTKVNLMVSRMLDEMFAEEN